MAAKEKVEAITAVYKVNLHCQECAREIKRPLMRTQGVAMVEFDMEKSEIKVKGKVDVIKIHKQIEKLSKKKVELISPKVKLVEKENIPTQAKKETKELVSRTVEVKIHMHCNKCEQDLKKNLLMHKGIHGVKTDMKAQTLIVDGTLEPDKLIAYLRKKLHKHAETITLKSVKKEEKKVQIEEKKDKAEKGDPKTEIKKDDGKKEKEKEEEREKGKEKEKEKEEEREKGKEKEKEKEKPTELIKAITANEEIKIVEVRTNDASAPYFIHYVYAPQIFSDENPNACFVM